MNINPKQKFTYEVEIKDENVYDGDTINNVRIDLGLNIFSFVDLRLNRIDTPEIKTKNPVEKAHGLEARDFLRNILRGRNDITIHILKYEKYGRCLSEVFIGEQNVNDILLEKGLAKPYNL
jgi:endonuclease YncB( thermonuclease family)